jgi:hypothetical protein
MSDVNTAPRGNSPAFPCQDATKQIWTGMNLRDYFALEAMNSLIRQSRAADASSNEEYAEVISTESYIIANAMLNEREKFR